MIRYSKKLYLTKKTEKRLGQIKLKLFTGAGMVGVFFILLSKNEEDVFDIVPAGMFKQKSFRKMAHMIIGIGESRRACNELVRKMIAEHYEVTGSYTELRKDIEDRVIG